MFLRDVGHGLLEVSHNTLALVGLMLAAVLLFAAGRADIRHEAEAWTLGWLQGAPEGASNPAGRRVLAAELASPMPSRVRPRPDPERTEPLSRRPWRAGCPAATGSRLNR